MVEQMICGNCGVSDPIGDRRQVGIYPHEKLARNLIDPIACRHWLSQTCIDNLRTDLERERKARGELAGAVTNSFWEGLRVEREFQRRKWGAVDDRNKAPADWFWLVGYLAGKALTAHVTGDSYKARHHTISAAAVLSHWWDAILVPVDETKPSDLEKAIAEASPNTKCLICSGTGKTNAGDECPVKDEPWHL
jgi:hypothetical protein